MKNTSAGSSGKSMHRRDLLRLLGLSALAGATGCDGQSTSPRPEAFSPQIAPGTGFVPDVELVLTAAPGEVGVLPGEPTRLWRFTGRLFKGPADTLQTLPGSYLGPVIRPIHMHGRQFRVVDRTGGRAPNTLRAGILDGGWRDTVLVLPGETVRVQVRSMLLADAMVDST